MIKFCLTCTTGRAGNMKIDVLMNNQQAHNLLRMSMKMLSGLPDELVDDLFDICKLVHMKKGQFFLMEGDTPEDVGFNLNGIFRLFYIDDHGNDLTKGFCTAGKFVISYSALAQKRTSYFSIEAIVDSDILLFKYAQWMQMAEADIRWYPFLFKLLESVYITKELREKSFLLDDAASRYLSFRKDYPGLEDKIKLYHIASFLGVTPEALSRVRKKLKLI